MSDKAQKLLTSRQCESAKVGVGEEKTLTDGGNLYLRVRETSKSWLFMYKWQGKLKKIGLGAYGAIPPAVSLAQARAKALRYQQWLAEGKDPKEEAERIEAEEKEKAKAVAARLTVRKLFDRWERLDLRARVDQGAEVRRMFEKDVFPVIGDMAADDVRKTHIGEIVDNVLERGVNRMARVVFALLRQMFRFALDKGYVESDPTDRIRKEKIGKPDVERSRVLSEAEVKELANKVSSAGLSTTTEAAIWIALSTGCRIGELLKARFDDVDLENRTWLIPAENSKNGKPLTVYLSEFSARYFETLKAVNGESEWCYPDREGKWHVCPKTVTKQIGDRQLYDARKPMSRRSKHSEALKLKGGKWTPHDLRRTAGTMMTALGVLPEVADRCLNHVEQNRIRRTYLRHSYDAERKDAWRLLGERLDLLTRHDAANVVTMQRGKAA